MNTLLPALAVLVAVGLALFPAGQLGAAEMAYHRGKGTVLSADPHEVRILMSEGATGSIAFALNSQTEIVDDTGGPIAPAALQAGDLVREECFFADGGKRTAKRIRLLRPAWMETASPEQ